MAQAQEQHTISHTESLELVRCLLRVVRIVLDAFESDRSDRSYRMAFSWFYVRLDCCFCHCCFPQSVFHVSAMRGLFPDSYFKDVTMKNLDGEGW